MARTRRRKKRTHVVDSEDPSKKGEPKSFVLRRGRHATVLKDLEADLRKLMSPNTASKLKESRRNVLKDFIHVAGPLGVTHLMLLSATHNAAYLRVAKSPRGPTLTLRIHEYSLLRDVLASQQRPRAPQSMWHGPPLVVMNNFNAAAIEDAEHLKLATVMFQNLFPSINVATTKLSACQRILLLDYNPETKLISLRHYSVAVQPSGVSKNLKSLLARRGMPDLGRMADVSEFLTRSGYGSESEGEDAEAGRVETGEDAGVGDKERGSGGAGGSNGPRQSRVRLCEVGPRMELEVVKVEEGLCGGRVLFHRYVKRSKAEEAAQETEVEARRKEKDRRRKEQDANVRKKQADKRRDDSGAAPRKGTKIGKDGKPAQRRGSQWWEKNDGSKVQEDDNDADWYLKEVGEQPDDDFKRAGARGGGRGGSGRGGGRGGDSRGRGRDGGRGRGDREGGRGGRGGGRDGGGVRGVKRDDMKRSSSDRGGRGRGRK